MPSFESLFLKSKGQPVEYNGRTIQMVDRLSVTDGQVLTVKFESVSSDWQQGVRLDIDEGFEINGQVIEKTIVLWHRTAPQESAIVIRTKEGELRVRNVWDTGDGVVHSWHNGAAMIAEDSPHGRRYRCNDGRADDDFDDLVFSVEFI